MVRAILDGRKTQTRRVCKVQPPSSEYELATCVSTTGDKRNEGKQHWIRRDGVSVLDSSQPYFSCPYGKPGDRLFGKEPWRVAECYDGMTGKQLGEIISRRNIEYSSGDQFLGCVRGRYRHARFMPRWASRITLEITGVRVERLQAISEADALAEGVEPEAPDECVLAFRRLWESINGPTGPKSWDADPYVWVLEFRRQ